MCVAGYGITAEGKRGKALQKRETKGGSKRGKLEGSPFDFSRTRRHHDGEAFWPGPLDSVGPFKMFLLVTLGAPALSKFFIFSILQ